MTRPSALKKLGRPRRRPKGKRIVMPPEEQMSSDAVADEDQTLSPTSSARDRIGIVDTEATTAPEIGEDEIEREQDKYVSSAAELVDKYILTRLGRGIPFAVILVITGVLFIQDNWAGKLKDWRSILWTIQKCSFFLVLFLVYRGILLVYRWVTKKKRA